MLRFLCWLTAIAALGAVYAESFEGHLRISWIRRVPLAMWHALPLALLGSYLAFRTRERRRRRFERPSTRAADNALFAFTIYVGAIGIIRLHGDWIPGTLWIHLVLPLFVVIVALRALGRRELERAWGLTLGERPSLEILAGFFAFAWAVSLYVARHTGNITLAASATIVVVVGPVIEEAFFRGALYTALRRSWGWFSSSLVVACLFALAHGFEAQFTTTLGYIVSGFVLCLVREWRGTLLPCIVAHAAWNAMVLAMLIR